MFPNILVDTPTQIKSFLDNYLNDPLNFKFVYKSEIIKWKDVKKTGYYQESSQSITDIHNNKINIVTVAQQFISKEYYLD